MQYFLVVLIIFTSGYIGKKLAKRYVIRDLFFKELINFLLFIKSNISFGQVKILDVFNDYNKLHNNRFSEEFKEIGKVIVDRNQIKDENLLKFLNDEEKLFVYKVFFDMGEFSQDIECEKIDEALRLIKNLSVSVEERRRKNEGVTFKLSLSIGVIICILIL